MYVCMYDRSCLFDTAIHWWIVKEVNITSYILMPLVVGIAFTDRVSKSAYWLSVHLCTVCIAQFRVKNFGLIKYLFL